MSPSIQSSLLLSMISDHPVEDAPDNVILTSVTFAPLGMEIDEPTSGLAP